MHRLRIDRFATVSLLTGLFSLAAIPAEAQQAVVEQVPSSQAPQVIRAALQQEGLGEISASDRVVISDPLRYTSHLMNYRVKLRFEMQGDAIAVSLQERQSLGSGGWGTPLVPPSKGSEAKLVDEIVDRLNEAKRGLTPGPVAVSAPEPHVPGATRLAEGTPANIGQPSSRPAIADGAKRLVFDTGNGLSYVCREGICMVARDHLWGGIDYQGNTVIDFKYSNAGAKEFQEGLIPVQDPRTGEVFFLDKHGLRQFPALHLASAKPFSDGVSQASMGPGKDILLDHSGKWIAMGQIVLFSAFSEGLAKGAIPSEPGTLRLGFYDKHLKPVIALQWGTDAAQDFHDGLAWVHYGAPDQSMRWGAIDERGKLVIPYKFGVEPHAFSEGLAMVECTNGLHGFVDKTGALAIPCEFGDAGEDRSFVNGHTMVLVPVYDQLGREISARLRLIDRTGAIVELPRGFDLLDPFHGKGIYNFRGSGGAGGLVDGAATPLFYSYVQVSNFDDDGPDGLAWGEFALPPAWERTTGFINKKGVFVVIHEDNQF